MMLLCYDGSADAQASIEHVARLMPGAEATVLTVWQPFLDVMAHSGALGVGVGMAGAYDDEREVDAGSRETALEIATEGAGRATAAGLVAQPRIASRHGGMASAVLAEAEAVDADLIVLGTRGLGGVKSFLLGSVSHEVVQHADRAVLVVPSPRLAEQRRGWSRQADSVA
jgi:nucleotide-binding universal stress UspA family protein